MLTKFSWISMIPYRRIVLVFMHSIGNLLKYFNLVIIVERIFFSIFLFFFVERVTVTVMKYPRNLHEERNID